MSENRCERCNRQLSDPTAQYGWRCAEILGVTRKLNHAGDNTFLAYTQGIESADEYLEKNNINIKNIDIMKFYESYAKQYLSAGMNSRYLHRLAYDDMLSSLSPRYDKNGKMLVADPLSPPLSSYLAWFDHVDAANGVLEKFKAKNELNEILDRQYDEFRTVDIQNIIKETGVANDYISSYVLGQNIIGKIADKRMEKVFFEIDKNQSSIFSAEKKFGIPKEIIASIMLKEGYTRSIPDFIANITTTIGKKIPFLESKMRSVFGEHSTGLGAIFPNTARSAWESYLGVDVADKLLPTNDLDLQNKIEGDDNFNIQTIAAVLAYEAKRYGYNTKDDLSSLSYQQWSEIIPHYNSGSNKNEASIEYANKVAEYIIPMGKYLYSQKE